MQQIKASLEKYIKDIFCSLQLENIPFDVYDCQEDTLPEWTNQIQITHEFLVSCRHLAFKEKLQKFLRKEICQHENFIYWFEGERIAEYEQPKQEFSESRTKTEVDYLKTETRLPQWLDDFIFNDLKAKYAPDFHRFEYNLDLSEDENLKYLGTYFPRSYTESFCIFDNIFQNKQYQKILLQKESLNILSVGCGTGGDLVGLLMVIEKYCPKICKINIWALDGNEAALSILEKVIEKFAIQYSKNINIKIIKSIFSSVTQIDIQQISEQTFDFILSFKMICEIIAKGKGIYDNSYSDFVMKFIPLLSNEGLCVLLDVTTKVEHATFNPILMNRQVNQALRELKNYQTLLPLSCNHNEKICAEQCFTQQKFYVSHKEKINDVSKVSYRVIAKTDFTNILVNGSEIAKYILQRNGQDIEKFCPYSHGEKIIDGYKLNKM